VINAEASGSTCGLDISSTSIIRDENSAPTARQPKSWLKVTKFRAIAVYNFLFLDDFVGIQGFAVCQMRRGSGWQAEQKIRIAIVRNQYLALGWARRIAVSMTEEFSRAFGIPESQPDYIWST
jgi:hypothetical protein